jgi:hypothetical protein
MGFMKHRAQQSATHQGKRGMMRDFELEVVRLTSD